MYIYIFMYTYIHIFIYISGYVYRQIDTYYIYIYIYKHTYMHTQNIPLVPIFFCQSNVVLNSSSPNIPSSRHPVGGYSFCPRWKTEKDEQISWETSSGKPGTQKLDKQLGKLKKITEPSNGSQFESAKPGRKTKAVSIGDCH